MLYVFTPFKNGGNLSLYWKAAHLLLCLLQDYVKRQTRFVSRQPANVIISTIEAAAESMGLKVHTRNYKVHLLKFYLHSDNYR